MRKFASRAVAMLAVPLLVCSQAILWLARVIHGRAR